MNKEIDKIIEALENISIKFDELGFSPTIPIPKGDKAHFVDWFKIEIDTIKVVTNQQAQRIAELEEQLKNSIRPKFKVNDKIFVIVNNEVEEYYVDEVLLKVKGILVAYRDICKQTIISEKNELFATKEEAEAKLEELQGENK